MPSLNLRVAVVDDEESVRKALSRLLRAAGLEVETYASGDELLAAVVASPPDCILIDLHMPVTDGFEVQEQLAVQGLAIPVIVVTGQDRPEYRVRARELGVAGYLCKPVRGTVLLDAILAADGRRPDA
jgi:FixJ family two-component response regulator